MAETRAARTQFIVALLISSLVSIGMLGLYGLNKHHFSYDFMVWNLFLAWLPLVFSLRLVGVLQRKLWSSWEAIITSLLWLLLLPNSFYMISDFIHLGSAPDDDVLYIAVMFSCFIITAIVLGLSSMFLVHREVTSRFSGRMSALFVSATLLLCSTAIYVGRDLRWNSWDVFLNPGGVIFDVSDRLLHPQNYPQMFVVVLSFFALLSSLYFVLWRGSRLLQREAVRDLL
ncbi:MAG: hypothetical protein JWM81_677 [Candidatus Saccharibacteria bacterium]|nr:hypothetical protein [Candidatus Saccharibacteria bacterium]